MESLGKHNITVFNPKIGSDEEKTVPLVYILHAQAIGLVVDFNGYSFNVHLSRRYLHKACGICGLYGEDSSDDLALWSPSIAYCSLAADLRVAV